MRGGLAASWTKMRVAKPKVVTSSARIMGVKARWVTLATQVLEDPRTVVTILLVKTGNISARDLCELLERHLPTIEAALETHTLVEIDRVRVKPVM
jgi:hypothetical protein